jgi:hypothetical protein
MKFVFPWQKYQCIKSCCYYHGSFFVVGEEYCMVYKKSYAATIMHLTNNDRSFYLCTTHTCIFPKFQDKEFNTLEEAKSYIDEQLKLMNIKLLPEHMLVLK